MLPSVPVGVVHDHLIESERQLLSLPRTLYALFLVHFIHLIEVIHFVNHAFFIHVVLVEIWAVSKPFPAFSARLTVLLRVVDHSIQEVLAHYALAAVLLVLKLVMPPGLHCMQAAHLPFLLVDGVSVTDNNFGTFVDFVPVVGVHLFIGLP